MKENYKDSTVKIIPLGGLGAIGKNIMLLEQGDDIIIIDCGIMFPRDEMPGIDYIIPDLSYVRRNKSKVKGIILTHGHEDHIGAISFLLQEVQAPIYATKLTIGLVRSRLEERPLRYEPRFVEVKPRQIEEIGPFTVEFIRVNHSIIGSVGLAIQTVAGTIIHSGDFKIDFSSVDGEVTDIYRFADYGEKGVLLLMSDSTNSEKPGFTKSEAILMDRLFEIFSESKGRVIVASFASNIQRIQQVLDTAYKFNRKVVISGLTMQKNIEIAQSLGFLDIKSDLIIPIEKASEYPNKKIVIIGTGTQGEPMSALARMAFGTHRHFVVEKGDTVIITASVIPGNERMVTNIINSLMETGANVYYDKEEEIHVSGHGSSKELKLMISVTKPKFFMPVHGEFKHLKKHAEIAESLNIKSSRIVIAKNGDVLELSKKSFKKIDRIALSEMYVDGSEVGDVAGDVIKERHLMSTEGVIFITSVISQGMALNEPDIISKGFVSSENQKIHSMIKREIEDRIRRLLIERRKREEIESLLSSYIKNYIYKITKRNPLIIVNVIEI
ncbi:MAG TPA: ribonuclease J [Spirochaetota bacterium]|jgi:ribonuclease J|nr:ribonuclease J [Spirochaetota bacterium]HON16224.1 ribonuclease J [Spirochaetota bacterium]HOV09572.1 ribonuclease J [Spirochaetota bacterium]HPD78214.1 ribonuclease J [Spirochaetota bacterium]